MTPGEALVFAFQNWCGHIIEVYGYTSFRETALEANAVAYLCAPGNTGADIRSKLAPRLLINNKYNMGG